MGLSQALATAMSGLRANQIALGLVSSNVANAETPGYIKKTSNQVAVTSGEFGSSVRVAGINRELDVYLQRQLRTEISGAAYAGLRAEVLDQLQSVYGTPGSAGTLESSFNALTNAVQALSTSSDSQSARIAVVNAAQSLVQQLNSMTRGIQSLRANAEQGLNGAVNVANNAMQQIANINVQLLRGGQTDGAAAELLDQRDRYIEQLSELMDVRVVANDDGQVNVFTNSGVQLVGAEAAKLSFDAQGTVTANTLWSADPAESTLGSITVNFPHGGSMDLFANNTFRSGKIAAYVELRDHTLVEAQAQLDQFAAALSSALSDRTVAGTAATVGAQTGFSLDLAGLQNGNVVNLTITNSITSAQSKISIVRVDDPSLLPLANNATNDPNDQVIGIDFSGGMASVVTQLNAALGGANIAFSNVGTTLTVLDDGAGNLSDVNAASVTTTMSSLTGGIGRAAAVQGRRQSLHRRVSRDRRAGPGVCRPDQRQHRDRQRSVEAGSVRGIDAVGRHHAAGLHLFAAHLRLILLFAGSRPWHLDSAVQGHAVDLRAAVRQRAGRKVQRRKPACGRPGGGAEHAQAEVCRHRRREYRRRDGAFAGAAECLCRERARDGRRQGNVSVAHADLVRSPRIKA